MTPSFQLKTLRVSVVIVEFYFPEMTGDRFLTNERYFTPCLCYLSIFTKIKLLVKNKTAQVVFSAVLLLKQNFCLRNTSDEYKFILNLANASAFARSRICLFRFVITGSIQSC